jgi:hypothetical protein
MTTNKNNTIKLKSKSKKYLAPEVEKQYLAMRRELEALEKKESDILRDIDKKLEPFKKQLGLTKMEANLTASMRQREKLEEKLYSFLDIVIDKMIAGAGSEIFLMRTKTSPGGISYKMMALHLLAELTGLKKNTKEFNKEFEKLRIRFGTGFKMIYTLLFQQDVIHEKVELVKECELKKVA